MPPSPANPVFTSLIVGLVAALVMAATPAVASAQPRNEIPGATTSSAQVSAFVSERIDLLRSGDPASVRQARRDLLAPLRTPTVESAFRIRYNGALQQAGLERLASHADDLVAINAVIIAGELATQLSVSIIDAALNDARPAVRYEAARAVGFVLNAYAVGEAAIPENQVTELFRLAGEHFESEEHAHVIDALIIALSAPNDEDGALRKQSVTAMCDGVSAIAARWRAGTPTESQALAIFRAIDTAFNELLNVQRGADRDFARAAAIASGHALAFLAEWLEVTPPADMSGDARQLAIDLGAEAERILILAHNAIVGELRKERITEPVRDFVEGRGGVSLADVRDVISEWTGSRGRLLASPYNAPSGAFD